jgi:hypothetical protein
VHPNDPDPFPSDPHAHVGSPNSSSKVNINTGDIHKNGGIVGNIGRKPLENLRGKLRGLGLLGLGVTVVLACEDIAQAGQEGGVNGAANAAGNLAIGGAIGYGSSVAVGGTLIGGASAAGTSITVGGAAAAGLGGAAAVGGPVIVVGGLSYAGGTYIANTNVAGNTVSGHVGNFLYWAAPSLWSW